MQLNLKNLDLQKKNLESHWKPRSRDKTTNLAPLAKSFWKHQKGNATYRTGHCFV